jgi:hypothetical protein
VQNRIQCKANLLKKKVVDSNICELCNRGSETADHIISECPFVVSFWNEIDGGAPT